MLKAITIAACRVAVACALASLQLASSAADLSDEQARQEMGKLPWQKGPSGGAVGNKASVVVPSDSALLPETSGARFLELTGNIPEPGNTIIVSGDWWAALSFNPTGYIKDDEKLDPDALLASLKDHDVPSNEHRQKLGIPLLYTHGWAVPPHYDPETKYLE